LLALGPYLCIETIFFATTKENTMSAIDSTGGLSTMQIMQWAAEHSGKMADTLQDDMTAANVRQDKIALLSELKARMSGIGNFDDSSARTELVKLRDDIRNMIASNPDLQHVLGPIADGIDGEVAGLDGDKKWDDIKGTVGGYASDGGVWGGALAGEIDEYRKADEMGMIEIQDQVSKLQQTQQLASNLISVLNDTNKSIIGNIRA
jgi:hypothetical protein